MGADHPLVFLWVSSLNTDTSNAIMRTITDLGLCLEQLSNLLQQRYSGRLGAKHDQIKLEKKIY